MTRWRISCSRIAAPRGWEDIGFGAMVALSPDGWPRSGMGVDAADIDGDGWQDLFVSNLDKEMFSLYRNTGHGMFDDLSFAGEIGRATYYLSGWGLKFFDFDNDGTPDLILANGHPDDTVSERSPKVRYSEPMLLFQQKDRQIPQRQRPGRTRCSSATFRPADWRSATTTTTARSDVLVGVNGGAPLLLKNNAAP